MDEKEDFAERKSSEERVPSTKSSYARLRDNKHGADDPGEKSGPESRSRRRSEACSSDSDQSDAEVQAEYEAALRKGNEGNSRVSKERHALKVVQGFRINWMDMRDASTSRLMWESGSWHQEMYRREVKATVPKDILTCAGITREINFTSLEEIQQFRLEQRIFLSGKCIEEWFFDFGFVISGSTNSWQQTIESAGQDRMLLAEDLSGKMTIETKFLDGNVMLFQTLVRVFYD